MTKFDFVYIIAGLALVIWELIAVYEAWKKNIPSVEKQTISRKIINWISKKPRIRRSIVILGLLWLVWHWGFQYF